MKHMSTIVTASAVLSLTSGALALQSVTFTPLDHGSGAVFSQATDVSDDGQYVSGNVDIGTGLLPIRWDGTSSTQYTIPSGYDGAYVNAIAGDGQTAVALTLSMSGFRGVRWDESGTPHILEPSVPGAFTSFNAINFDGTAVGGFTNQDFFTGSSDAVIWTSKGGEEVIGDIPGAAHEGNFTAISNDGSLYAGFGTDSARRPVKWSAKNGFTILPDTEGNDAEGMIIEMSSGGNVLVGQLDDEGDIFLPAYWTGDDNAREISLWPGYAVGEAVDALDDGSVIVGNWRETPFSDEMQSLGFIWDDTNGARPLEDVLVDDYGADLQGWSLNHIIAISADGSTIVGTGLNPEGNLQAYKVTFSAKPGPVGDLNDDGNINVSDLLILLGEWGNCPKGDACPADLNDDGVINVSDMLVLLANWT